ncbi:thioredoxin [Lewinellaceae bacterium SD302]|nr:thioredoxin [Lewinellaceae bacterium SD302]
MRKSITISLLVLAVLSFGFFTINAQSAEAPAAPQIEWMTIEEALAANEETPKKMFIDVYTDWCHWCKVMDDKTFSEAEVIDYLNDNFYPVKFNAEQKEPITFKGQTYEYTPAGRRGIHLLAYALLNKQASYPSFVVLDEELNGITILKGFQDKAKFLGNLKRATSAK